MHSIGISLIDESIRTALQAVRTKFPQPLISAYLTGSYANDYFVPTSDVDLLLVFPDTSQIRLGESQAD